MNSKLTLVFAILAVSYSAVFAHLIVPTAWPPIGGDLISTIRIAAKLCLSELTEEQATGFWNCYNEAPPPGIDIFADCQQTIFGFRFDSVDNIKEGCRSLVDNFLTYASCIQSGFTEAGLDLISAGEQINICEAEVLGLES